jgi:hypothetical protein
LRQPSLLFKKMLAVVEEQEHDSLLEGRRQFVKAGGMRQYRAFDGCGDLLSNRARIRKRAYFRGMQCESRLADSTEPDDRDEPVLPT